jgi:hypothetical protein
VQPVNARRRRVVVTLAGTSALLTLEGLSGCATWFRGHEAPMLRLSPASLGRELSVVQRMDIDVRGQTRSFDAALEVDADELRLAVLQLGQTTARLTWDGQTLTQSLAPGWPQAVSASSVLSDLQYVWWPRPEVQAALPSGWVLDEGVNHRVLRRGDNVVLDVRVPRSGMIELTHRGAGYLVRLQTQGAQPTFVSP